VAAALLALAFLALVAIDLFRDQRVDLRPVLTHPRWLLVAPAAGALASALARDPFLFLIACALIGAAAALLCERFRLTENGIECRGVLFAWQVRRIKRPVAPAQAFALFKQHIWAGALILAGFWSGVLLR